MYLERGVGCAQIDKEEVNFSIHREVNYTIFCDSVHFVDDISFELWMFVCNRKRSITRALRLGANLSFQIDGLHFVASFSVLCEN